MTQAIFLSYASQDADAARRICDALRGAGLEVWFDQSELRGGDAWDASIRKQIKECSLFVPIISTSTNARSEGYFRLEWKLAVDRSHQMSDERPFLLPVVIDDVAEPSASVPDRFRERQWSRLKGEHAIAEFALRVKAMFSADVATPSVPPPVQNTSRIEPASIGSPSVAVLAFANRSSNVEDEYFSDGLADELLNVLAKIRGLRVAARTSAFSFRGKSATIAEIGRALNVETVLEGSVRKSGNRARISVQLVNVADGYHLWSETYDRLLDDIFAVQDDIAQSVVTQLRATLMGEKTSNTLPVDVVAAVARAAKGRSDNVAAQRLYMQGRYLLNRKSADDLIRSITYFQEAVALDPGFGLAWASLAEVHHYTGCKGLAPVHEANARALAAADKARTLAPDLVETHLSRAGIQLKYQFDWDGAQASLRRALELEPENAEVLARATQMEHLLGNLADSIVLGRHAVERDPLNTTSRRMLATTLFDDGDAEGAVRLLQESLALSPDLITVHGTLAMVLGVQGHHNEALAEALREKSEWVRLTATSLIKWLMNEPAESNRLLAQLEAAHGHESAVQIAFLHAMRGSADKAFVWLDRAFAQRDAGVVDIKPLRFFEPIRNDPRWAHFLRKTGHPG